MSLVDSAQPSRFQRLTSTDPAAIGIVGVTGPAVPALFGTVVRFETQNAATLTAGSVRRAKLTEADGEIIDDIVISVWRASPDWEIWLHLHGGPWIMRRCCERLKAAGYHESSDESGEAWRSHDALEATIWGWLPRMKTLEGARWLLSQRDRLPKLLARLDGTSKRHPKLAAAAFRALRERGKALEWYSTPVRIALIGPPNAGKSTLANRLAGCPVSLESTEPGTTRDWIEIPAEVGGFPVTWIDTAGVFEATSSLDAAGVEATHRVAAKADVILLVLDSRPEAAAETAAFLNSPLVRLLGSESRLMLVVWNKTDAVPDSARHRNSADHWGLALMSVPAEAEFWLSGLNGEGLDRFQNQLMITLRRYPRRSTGPADFRPDGQRG
ncbi:MAG: 50S ribosome-binding GTPase [Planctomycetes bacterium]|nr:50S ribosome-binding GTPase [Planctomycetota bacterium]